MPTVTLGLRLRFSLLVRTVFALCILGTLTLVLSLIISVFGAFFGFIVWGWLFRIYEFVLTMPRVSAMTPVPSTAVAPLALLVLVGIVYGWEQIARYTSADTLLPPTDPASATLSVVALGSLYLLVVEGIIAIGVALSAALSALDSLLVVFLVGAALAVVGTVGEVRQEIGSLRENLLDETVLAEDAAPEVERTTHRLAQLADVPPPEVRVAETDRPESFTIGTGTSAVVVVSRGLVEALEEAELEAVLAHEVSHLANQDSRIMGAALAPVLAADDWIDQNPSDYDVGDWLWNALFRGLKWFGQLGVAVFSRGRELSADTAGAALTGSPAALSSALRRLDEERRTPETDLRAWEDSVTAIDILPPSEREGATGPFRTHPSTDARIERLRRMAAETERE
ncbi:M48 family metallopeptidase [Natronomonas amylolytica]|uniref:M48 family metallopeptidase n=1 Tax=Natronomonas amylolytica TaxID=3108498 RepID=UPI00300B0E12